MEQPGEVGWGKLALGVLSFCSTRTPPVLVPGAHATDTRLYQCASNPILLDQELGQRLGEWRCPYTFLIWAAVVSLKAGTAIAFYPATVLLNSGHRRALLCITFDFLERWIRNFSYCSIAKIRFGMGLVSRSTLAWNAERRTKDQIRKWTAWKFSCNVITNKHPSYSTNVKPLAAA